MSGVSERIVQEARAWIGTPYRHQASCKGAGADCLGLLRGVWRDVYGAEPEAVPAYSADWSEPQGEERLWAAARRRLVAKAPNEAALGDVVLFRMREQGVAKHLGITSALGAAPKFIHAYSGHGVVESPFSEPWARRVVARFEFPKAGS
ncbi:NlpC/P60 family putative phage cell wall peptidase [Litoreibacter halocynthiae]|uniref:NlpC/P60 family putative phage cell wall peptidase n=1 Tax=Litoreibacter halocynthiae TaxID=1242689 RepID=A0A4V6Q3C9_9RHOB|nr:NlpC/P60 family protein [Litoreibacter halocynthiae]TDT78045.1 NlpC/P60 family putative phage cell wall peptidase [Litoreibacter halocynthiae]